VAWVVAGLVLALGGGLLGDHQRLGVAAILAVVAIPVGAAEASGRRVRLLQLDRETPQRWVRSGAIRWAAANGAALGTGFASRVGFPLWYVVPMASWLTATPEAGAILYGTYGVTRAGAVVGLLPIARRIGLPALSDRLHAARDSAHRVAGAWLVAAAVVVMVVPEV
jgi:hypothetical protein